jgi:hypothetical protein
MDGQKAFAAWQSEMARRMVAAKTDTVDWSKVKIDPAQLGVEMGPVLTEEQFKAYCESSGVQQHVIKSKKK